LTDQWFGLTYVQIAVAVLVAILGIVNSLTVSITDRRRELGILQAVGALRKQIRRTIYLEAFCTVLIGLVLGLHARRRPICFTAWRSRAATSAGSLSNTNIHLRSHPCCSSDLVAATVFSMFSG
jgi:cell division protein FtsX